MLSSRHFTRLSPTKVGHQSARWNSSPAKVQGSANPMSKIMMGADTLNSKKRDEMKVTKDPVDKLIQDANPPKKTQAKLDQELLAKLQGRDGDGGAAGVEYEDGKPVSMKRSVRNNMFRYI